MEKNQNIKSDGKKKSACKIQFHFVSLSPFILTTIKDWGKSVDTPMKALVGTNSMKNIPSKSDEHKQSNYPANAILVLAPLTPFYLENAKSLHTKKMIGVIFATFFTRKHSK